MSASPASRAVATSNRRNFLADVPCLGQREHPLVGPAFLVDDTSLDQALLGQAIEFAVELLGCGHPEVGHRGIEALGQVIAGRLPVEQGRQHRIPQRHRTMVKHLITQQSD